MASERAITAAVATAEIAATKELPWQQEELIIPYILTINAQGVGKNKSKRLGVICSSLGNFSLLLEMFH